jgi:hydrogenase maturation protein HypF
MIAQEIRITGIVQEVGFRPTVYRLAQIWQLKGEVLNDGEGVLIRVLGEGAVIEGFLGQLERDCPPLAQIREIRRR